MNLTEPQLAIIKTLAHYDVLDYPLTLLEIHKFCEIALSPEAILTQLESTPLKQLLSQHDGLYYLTGREAILTLRHQRYCLALKKLGKAQRAARILNYLPWVRAVALYSSLALKNSRASGDLDLFFITASGRAWSTRFIINSILSIFNLRPKSNDTTDKLCTSYFVDQNNLDLSISNAEHDYYYAYGTGSFIFLAGDPRLVADFFQANDWLNTLLPNWLPTYSNLFTPTSPTIANWQAYLEKICNHLPETTLQKLQLKLLPPKYQANNDSKRVLLSTGIIKTHDNDKREKFNQLFEANYHRVLTAYDQTT